MTGPHSERISVMRLKEKLPVQRSIFLPSSCLIAGVSLFANLSVEAAVISVNQFTGDVSETFDQYDNTNAAQSIPVFGGAGTLQNLSPGGAIKIEFSSTFQGYQVTPLNDMMGGQLGIAQWKFNSPVTRFGGWFENNSGADNATISFFDVNNTLIQSVTADIPFAEGWTWNGWQSDTPISRIVVSGNGIVNGFLWYENMQIDFAEIPAPPALALVVFAIALMPSRRRRPRNI
jgi:hypothetical protein